VAEEPNTGRLFVALVASLELNDRGVALHTLRHGQIFPVRLTKVAKFVLLNRFISPGSLPYVEMGSMKNLFVVLLTAGLVLSACGTTTTIQVEDVETKIESWLVAEFEVETAVNCGDRSTVPAEKGYSFICDATDADGPFELEVTVLSESGDIEWEVLK